MLRTTKRTITAVSLLLCITFLMSTTVSALSLSYNAGSAYKSSYYYDAISDYELTGDNRYDIVSIALSQLGYHTGEDDSEMHGENIRGIKGFVEYNRIYGKVDNGQGNGVSYGYYWCACFVSWCMRQAGIPTSKVPTKCASRKILSTLQSNGTYADASSGYTPLCGDIIFFRNADGAYSTHIGIVVGVKNGYVYTIEGNANDHVTARKYPLNDSYIEGYGKINYNTIDGVSYDFALAVTDELFFPYYGTEPVPVHTAPGEDNDIIYTFPANTQFDIIYPRGCWVKVATPNGEGWCNITPCEQAIPDPEFAVKYYLCGGVGGTLDQISLNGEAITISSTAPIRTGYTFKGWSESPGGEVKYLPGDTCAPSGNNKLKKLYAVWKADKHTVKFLDESGNTLLEKTVEYGSKMPSVTAPSKPSDETYKYQFKRWSPSASPIVFKDAVYTPEYTAIKLVPDTLTTEADTTSPIITTEPETDGDTGTESSIMIPADTDPLVSENDTATTDITAVSTLPVTEADDTVANGTETDTETTAPVSTDTDNKNIVPIVIITAIAAIAAVGITVFIIMRKKRK